MDNCIGFAESVDQVVPPTQGAHFVGQFCQAAAEEAADMPARTCDRDWAAEKRTHLTPPPQLPSSWKPSSASCRIVDVDARPPARLERRHAASSSRLGAHPSEISLSSADAATTSS